MDPTGTPLNVRASPNGDIVGTLRNGVQVTVLDRSMDRKRQAWVYVGRSEDRSPIGWVYRQFIACGPSEPPRQTSQSPCEVMDPTGTPLNVRANPNGRIVGTLRNGVLVFVLDQSLDRKGQSWAYVGRSDQSPIGWVYRPFLACESNTAIQQFRRFNGQAFRYAGQETFTANNYEECERRCASVSSCVALTFFGNIRQCRMMQSTTELIGDQNADSGTKVVNSEVRNTPAYAPAEQQPTPKVEQQGSSGTGFFVTLKGHVLTNFHVVKDCKRFALSSDFVGSADGHLIASDSANDLAVLATQLTPTAVPALNSKARVGDSIFVYGFPLAGLLATSGNFTMGNIAATAGLNDDTSMFQISAPVQPGNSGGPLIDEFGNVIGVIVGKLNAINIAKVTDDIAQNVNFSIKAGVALNFLESHGLDTVTKISERRLGPSNIADLAKQFTVRVTCQ